MLQPWVIAESFETNPYRDEERIIVYTPYLLTDSGYRRKNAGGCGISVENAKRTGSALRWRASYTCGDQRTDNSE